MIRVDSQDRTARIRLDRPDRLNAISPKMLRDLTTICEELADDPSIRVVTLESSGESFSAGADLPLFGTELRSAPRAVADLGRVATDALAGLPQIHSGTFDAAEDASALLECLADPTAGRMLDGAIDRLR